MKAILPMLAALCLLVCGVPAHGQGCTSYQGGQFYAPPYNYMPPAAYGYAPPGYGYPAYGNGNGYGPYYPVYGGGQGYPPPNSTLPAYGYPAVGEQAIQMPGYDFAPPGDWQCGPGGWYPVYPGSGGQITVESRRGGGYGFQAIPGPYSGAPAVRVERRGFQGSRAPARYSGAVALGGRPRATSG